MIAEQLAVVVLGRYPGDLGRYLPLETTDRLLLNPFSKILKPDTITEWQRMLPNFLLMACIYFVVYCMIAIWYFKKKDL